MCENQLEKLRKIRPAPNRINSQKLKWRTSNGVGRFDGLEQERLPLIVPHGQSWVF